MAVDAYHRKMVRGEAGLNDIYNVLHAYSQYPGGAAKLFFTANHDENSWNGTEYEKYGNLAKAFAVLTFTWKGVPLIYSGQELPNNKRLRFLIRMLLNGMIISNRPYMYFIKR